MGRKANAICDRCGKPYYRRPYQEAYEHGYCSRKCFAVGKTIPERECQHCKAMFKPVKRTQRYCSRRCAGVGSRRPWSTKKNGMPRNANAKRLAFLKEKSGADCCMVQGCDYGRTLDVHRLVEGKDGGKYSLGNMFMICPNHHAEIHRGVVRVEKGGDFVLRAIDAGDMAESG